MRVLLVDPAHRVPFYDRSLSSALARAGMDVTLATAPLPYYEAPTPGEGVRSELRFGRAIAWLIAVGIDPASHASMRRVVRAASYGPELAGLYARAVRGGRAGDFVVHSQWSLAPRVDAAVWGQLRKRGVPVVHTAHNVLPHEHDSGDTSRWRRLYASADRVIAHSEASKDRLLTLGGLPPDLVRVVPMPVETLPFEKQQVEKQLIGSSDPSDAARSAARSRLDLPASAPLALFFGQIRPYKGLDVLLDAWPAVLDAVPTARLVIAGPVLGGARAESELMDAIQARGIASSVILRLGYVPTEKVEACFTSADVIALPYLETDGSAVLATALGLGRASVVSAVGGLPEALAHGGGLLVPPGDASALASALGSVLGSSKERDRLERGAQAAASAWTWENAARSTIDIYSELIDDGCRDVRAPLRRDSASDHRSAAVHTAPDLTIPEVPFVSVLIPARNAERHIEAAIDALLSGDWPSERLEILVSEGLSEDGTRRLLEGIAEREPRLRVIDNPTGSTPAALNAALSAAKGDVIVRLDAHATPAPDYLTAAVDALRRAGAWAVGGPMVGRGETPFGSAVAIAQSTRLGSGGAAYRHGRPGPADTVYLGAWSRAVLDTVDGWDEGLMRNQDAELCQRIRAAGGSIVLDPAIRTTTITRGSPSALARQYAGYGAGRAVTLVRHPRSLALRQAVPAAFVAVLCVLIVGSALAPLAPFAQLTQLMRSALLALATLYGVTVVTESARGSVSRAATSLTDHLTMTGRISAALAIMHFSWGLGFWWGLGRALIDRPRRHGDDSREDNAGYNSRR